MTSPRSRLSPEGLAVLQACARSVWHYDGVGGCLYVADLVRRAPGRPAVARASLSRPLRRLWRAGWVELVSAYGYSLTALYADAAADLHAAESDPEGTYARAAAAGGFFHFVTPEEYLGYLRRCAARRPRGRPMHIVQITSAGRERLTSLHREVNRKPKSLLALILQGTPPRPGCPERAQTE